jgi:hypothetical protein
MSATRKRTSRRKGWSVTVTVNGKDAGSWRGVQAVEPWTAVYYVLRYGAGVAAEPHTLAGIDGLTVTVRPDPVPPTVEGGAA